jgi:outer membrane protease
MRRARRGLYSLVLILVGALCAAQSFGIAGWTVSAEAGASILYGTAYEYVYDANTGNKLSQLNWDIKPVLTVASSLLVQHQRTLFEFSCSLGLDGNRGIMTDSDWLNEASGDASMKTNYSESAAMGTGFTDLGLSVRQSFRLSPTVDLSSFVGFRYIDIAWAAQGGWLQYASNDTQGSLPPYYVYTTGQVRSMSGTVSTYEQRYYAVILGVDANAALSREFSFFGSLHFSPIVIASALDYHALRDVTFSDSMSGGFLVQPALGFAWSPVSSFDLRLEGSYFLISGLKGSDTATAGPNSNETNIARGQTIAYPNTAGAGIEFLSLDLSATLRL